MKQLGFGLRFFAVAAFAIAAASPAAAADQAADASPLKVLMITGGGWHDYQAQKQILANGIGQRANVKFTIDHSAETCSQGEIQRHKTTAWAEEFDLVLYNMCFAEMRDVEWSRRIVHAHVEHQVPAVVLHCAMHSYNYHRDDDTWLRFAGVRTHRHQDHMPFTVEVLRPDHPVMANFPRKWTTPQGELYNIEEVFDTATPLAHAFGEGTGQHQVNIWVNEYQGVRVFGTTIGHHNETMAHENYLNLVTGGLLWAAGKLGDDGQPQPGYGPTAGNP